MSIEFQHVTKTYGKTKALDGITVEQGGGPRPPQGPRRLLNREHRAQLVVDQHHGHQRRVRAEGPGHLGRINVPRVVRLEVCHLVSLPLQRLEGLQHGGVLHRGGDDVPALPPVYLQRPENGPVVTL